MKKVSFFIIVNFVVAIFSQDLLSGYPPAIDLPYEDIQTVTGFLRMTYQGKKTSELPEWSLENFVEDKKSSATGGIWKNNTKKRFVIAYHGKKSFIRAEQDLIEATPNYNLQGKIDRQAFDIEKSLHEKLSSSLNPENKSEYEYIFTGYGLGGSVAALAASRFVSTYKLSENQVKIINFSSSKIGDEVFTKSLYEKLPLTNILHFHRHLDIDFGASTKHVGTPIEITITEGVIDTVSHIFTKLPRRTLEIGTATAGFYALSNYLPYLNHSNSQNNYLVGCATGLALTLMGAYDFFTCTDIPSDDLVTRAFCYTQTRNKTGVNLSEAGKIWMLFGSRT